MWSRTGFPRLVPELLLSVLLAVPAAGEDAAAGVSGRYIVFEIGADGSARPQMHRFVRFAAERRSLTSEEVAARLAAAPRDEERIRVRMFGPDGASLWDDVVSVPRWDRAEHAASAAPEDGEAFESRIAPASKRSFVVRVPAVERSWLALSVGREGGTPRDAAFRDAEFDLDALAADAALPLARFAPEVGARAAAAANSGNRVDVLIMGDGYTSAETNKFNNDAANVVSNFFGLSPYNTYRNFFNTALLFTASPQSGADHPPYNASCAASFVQQCCADPAAQTDLKAGTFVNTAYDSTYCSNNTHRALVLDSSKVLAAAAATPDWDLILVIANDTTYGATGGVVAVVSTHPSAVNSAQHELGHSFALLADEYDLAYPGYPACSDITSPPCEANVTNQTSRGSIKWNEWIAASTPVPTPATSQFSSAVGLFEGARYTPTGFYRPRQNCLMRALGQPFCEICKQEFVLRFYEGGWGVPAGGIDLIEPGSESPAPGFVAVPFPGSQTFSVDVLEPSSGSLQMKWFIDNAPAAGASGPTFTYHPTAEGSHQIEVQVTDTTGLVRDAADPALVSSRRWTAGVGQGGRFAIEVDWAVPSQGRSGVGTEVSLTPDTRYFWFFTPANIELVIKVLDARGINQHYWVFYGALSSVQYTIRITDTVTGAVKTYTNPPGTLASVADIEAFEGDAAAPTASLAAPGSADLAWALAAQRQAGFAPGGPTVSLSTALPGSSPACSGTARNLCLNSNRFQVQVDWAVPSQGRTGTGTAVPITSDTGYFWFFTSTNVELVIKVLDGRGINDHFWVFYGALSSVQYTIRITDTATGTTKTYTNPSGTLASVADTAAF